MINNLYFVISMMVFITAILAFCTGLIFPVLLKKCTSKNSPIIRFALFIRKRAGYLASFGLGVFLTMMLNDSFTPYTLSKRMSLENELFLEAYMMDKKEYLLKGEVPQEIVD